MPEKRRVPKRIAQTVLNSLKGGVVPRIGLPYITVGRKEESEEAQKLGLKIIGHLRERMDEESQKLRQMDRPKNKRLRRTKNRRTG